MPCIFTWHFKFFLCIFKFIYVSRYSLHHMKSQQTGILQYTAGKYIGLYSEQYTYLLFFSEMKKGERMKRLIVYMLGILLMSGTVCGQDDFQTQAKRVFSSAILKSVKLNNGIGEILFKDPPKMQSYFRTGDKISKVFQLSLQDCLGRFLI